MTLEKEGIFRDNVFYVLCFLSRHIEVEGMKTLLWNFVKENYETLQKDL